MKRKIISLLLTVAVVLAMLPTSALVTQATDTSTGTTGKSVYNTIKIGEYITLGTYQGKPIVWQCVDIDEYGPLMLCNDVLCIKEYDAAGENSEYHTDGWGWIRSNHGSNCWSDSNIRQWLNSSGDVEYTHCPPSYSSEVGFMSNFSADELALVKTVTQRSYLNEMESHRAGYIDGGSREPSHIEVISKLEDDLSTYWYQNVTDMFFLLERTQIYSIFKNNPAFLYRSTSYFTRYAGNYGASYENVCCIRDKDQTEWLAANTKCGIRPAFYLNTDYAEHETGISEQEIYLLQHLNFVNSTTYDTVANDYRYAKILWTNCHQGFAQEFAEAVYNTQEATFEFISFQEISALKNPYDVVLLDLLSSKSTSSSVSKMVESDILNVINSVVKDLSKLLQDDDEWVDDINISDNFKDLLDTDPSEYSSNKLYQSLDKYFQTEKPGVIDALFGGYKCYDKLAANLSDGAKGVDYFLQLLKYTAAVEAYYHASVEFKAVLAEVAEVMPTVNETFAEKFREAYDNYSVCVDYNSVMQTVLDHAAEEGFWLVSGLMSEVLQDTALTFCKTALKMSEASASALVAYLWAAETGFNLGNLITDNDTLMSCRRLLRANYMLDEAMHYVMDTHAAELKSSPSYDEAVYFDAAFNLYKNLQISSLQIHVKYLRANGSSFLYFMSKGQERFNREAEAKAVIINTWKNITCHTDVDSSGAKYSKSNTIVVACPTDVYVYNKKSGELVASVINNVVYNSDNTLTVIEEANEKAICVPNFDDYEIKIQATDVGTMTVDYKINSMESSTPERIIAFNDVAIENESVFDLLVDSEGANVSLMDQNDDIILPDVDTFNLVFKGASLSLHHNLAINYKVDKALFESAGYTNPYVEFEMNGKKSVVSEYSISGDRYVFTFHNIAPNQMNDVINATLYATYDGRVYSGTTREYSVAEYCYSMLARCSGSEYAELWTLLVDLLNYGAVSQQYTNYNTDSLVNANLTEAQKLWGTSTTPILKTVLNTTYETVENPTAAWKGAGLALNEAVSVRLKFTAEDVDGLMVKVTTDTNEWTIASDEFVEQDGFYYVYFNGLHAGQMRETLYLTICKDGEVVSNTVTYSIESYAYEKQNSSIDYLANLVKAMMKYGDSAYAYAN